MLHKLKALLLALSLWSTLPAAAAPISRDDPESTDPGRKGISTARGSAVVVTANPLASTAALAALKNGGSAIDALVTAQAVLAVVEPQSSGLAGGGFLLHWEAKQRQLSVLDGREVAPERSRPGDLLDGAGDPLPWRQATSQANAIGIPGTVALLWEAHQNHGRLPWAQALQPAIRLASDGFLPSPRLLRSIRLAQRFGVAHSPEFQALYLPGGQPPAADHPFRNPALARTLKLLAREGGPAFYQGPLAQQILDGVNALQASEPNFRGWSSADLSSYAVVRRTPLCSQQLQHRICTVPPPSSGGLALLQTLALLNQTTNLASSSAGEPQVWRQLARAQAWADADRLYWVHDPIDGAVPSAALLDPAYIASRARAMQGANGSRPTPGLAARHRSLSLRQAGSGHRTGHQPDHHRGCQRQHCLLHLFGGDDLRESAPCGRHGDEQSAHRFRLQAQPWRQTGRQPPAARTAADVVDGADAGVPQR